MELRYLKNTAMLSESDMERLNKSRVCIIGCGGLGGYIIEMLGRLGVGFITAIDGDRFDETNLNRQLLSKADTLGKGKAITAQERMLAVNPLIHVVPVSERLTPQNGIELLDGHDVLVDAVDNIETRMLLKDLAVKLDIPLVHGAIAGWYGQVSTIFPGDRTLDFLYPRGFKNGIEKELGNPSFTPGLVASIEVSEVVKLLINKGELLRNRILYIDTLSQEYTLVTVP